MTDINEDSRTALHIDRRVEGALLQRTSRMMNVIGIPLLTAGMIGAFVTFLDIRDRQTRSEEKLTSIQEQVQTNNTNVLTQLGNVNMQMGRLQDYLMRMNTGSKTP